MIFETEYGYEELKKCCLCHRWIETKYVRLVDNYYHRRCLEKAWSVYYCT